MRRGREVAIETLRTPYDGKQSERKKKGILLKRVITFHFIPCSI